MENNEKKIVIAGFGGQGVILSGVILGWAAVLDGKNAIQTQSYGSSARGGACKCDVIVSDTEINELEPEELDILVSFSQPAFDKFNHALSEKGKLFIDTDLVLEANHPAEKFGIPSTDMAHKELNHKIMANIVMLGYLNKKINLVSQKSLEESVKKYTPDKFEEENMKALKLGIEME